MARLWSRLGAGSWCSQKLEISSQRYHSITTLCWTKSHITRGLRALRKLSSHLGTNNLIKRDILERCLDRSSWRSGDSLILYLTFKGTLSSFQSRKSQLLWMRWIRWTYWTCLKTTSGGYSTTGSLSSFSFMNSSFTKTLSPIRFNSYSSTV